MTADEYFSVSFLFGSFFVLFQNQRNTQPENWMFGLKRSSRESIPHFSAEAW
jgi:hypothetical protein